MSVTTMNSRTIVTRQPGMIARLFVIMGKP